MFFQVDWFVGWTFRSYGARIWSGWRCYEHRAPNGATRLQF